MVLLVKQMEGLHVQRQVVELLVKVVHVQEQFEVLLGKKVEGFLK